MQHAHGPTTGDAVGHITGNPTLPERAVRKSVTDARAVEENLYPPCVRERKPPLPGGHRCAVTLRRVQFEQDWRRATRRGYDLARAHVWMGRHADLFGK
jgi:hypothetical protein